MNQAQHRFIETNGIKMHIAEQGSGALVILCHGFPEIWYSWRHQLKALAEAGFHAVAPDQRGYGQTDRPEPIEAYNILQLTGDIVGLIHAIGESKAIIVGHDWGAIVAWHCALLRPDIFHGLVLLSVPYLPRSWSNIRPTQTMKQKAGDKQFYQLYFQEPGLAEAELEANVRQTMASSFYTASGEAPPQQRWNPFFPKSQKFFSSSDLPEKLPTWLTESELELFTKEFERTGFRGGLNWYRNIDKNWELTSFLSGAQIQQPTLFVAGEADAVMTQRMYAFQTLEHNVPNLKQKTLLSGAGHWIQQERPDEVNQILVNYLKNF
jgi:pimeloyl-ACP methyl ester carboxylesterase